MNLFTPGVPFWKGNLHCHTTESDGLLSPRDVKALYRGMGYDFLALTDHRLMTEDTHMEDGMLLLSGTEMDFDLPGEVIHLIGIGMSPEYRSYGILRSAQSCINLFRQCGGRAILAHPAWSLNTLSTLTGLRGISATEIYNSVSTYPWNADRADSSVLLDIAASHGRLHRFVASDDSHRYNGEAGVSFTMIQAEELTQESLFHALDEGRFYCSQGPRFEQITVEDGHVKVACSPVDTIIYCSNRVWSAGRCQTGKDMTSGCYNLSTNPGETFVRVQIIDAQGRSAWSNPISLNESQEAEK